MFHHPNIKVEVKEAEGWPLIAKVKRALAIGSVHPDTIDLFTEEAMAVMSDNEKLMQTCSRWVALTA